MPVIKVNDQPYSLRPGANRLGDGDDADVRVGGDPALGIQAIIDIDRKDRVVIRRSDDHAVVRVNGVALIEPTPLIHGDKVEICGHELLYSDDTKSGATRQILASEIAAIAQRRPVPPRATAATGGRLVSLVDGKEYAVPEPGLTIGRDAGSIVVVAQSEVSRRHAEIVAIEQGYEVRDSSANGVFVNGARVSGSAILSRADVIRIGTEEFRFYADVAPIAKASVSASPEPDADLEPAPEPALASEPAAVPAAAEADSSPIAGGDVVAPPLLATLEVTNEGPTRGRRYDVRIPLVHIGRGAHNDLVLADDSVSDTHAKLQRRDDGWYMVDVGSTNGTYVGGQRIPTERRLDGPAVVRFGGVKMAFQANDTLAETSTGTRAIASLDRAKLRDTGFVPAVKPVGGRGAGPVPVAPVPVAASVMAQRVDQTREARGVNWLMGVILLAIGLGAAFFLLNR